MFYPLESLKLGGRFYLCWVADSWPQKFLSISSKHLWSQDIRKLCDDLLVVMTNESGRPSKRFSLRLSSQLMRGLVRLYDRKVTILLNDLYMIHDHVFKNVNKKLRVHEAHIPRPLRALPRPPVIIEEPENEKVEEMIQNSGNVVANIQDITLKEATIPDFQLPPNDGFGEENQEQVLRQLLGDRTVELMLAQPETSVAQHSGLEPLEMTDKSHDKTRLGPHDVQMERLSDQDITVLGKSIGTAEPQGEFEKDIPEIPEIPLLVIPALPLEIIEPQPLPQEDIVLPQPQPPEEAVVLQEEPHVTEKPAEKVTEDIELEELEEDQLLPARKRRGKKKLIIDKKTKLSSEFLRARIENPHVDLRCENFTDDIMAIAVPWEVYSRRPAASGPRLRSRLADDLVCMYKRNLATIIKTPFAARHIEELEMEEPRQKEVHAALSKTMVAEPQPLEMQEVQEQPVQAETSRQMVDVTTADITARDLNVTTDVQLTEVQVLPQDIADLPTQVLATVSPTRKRTLEYDTSPKKKTVEREPSAKKKSAEYETSPKKKRSSGFMSCRLSQQSQKEAPPVEVTEKENLPPPEGNIQKQPVPISIERQRDVSAMLQKAGLADIQLQREVQAEIHIQPEQHKQARREESDSSETPLGSLDRTKVSLGDSVKSTDSQRFISNNWGMEATMMRIMDLVSKGRRPITVESMVSCGPTIPGRRRIIAARCFSSILKLKQHGFIRIEKDPQTLAIIDITLGPKFEEN